MSRPTNHGDEKAAQPGWKDIAKAIDEVAAAHGGRVVITLERDALWQPVDSVWVRAQLVQGKRGEEGNVTGSVAATWPTQQHSTMPGLMLRLLHQLDYVAEDRQRAQQEGLPF